MHLFPEKVLFTPHSMACFHCSGLLLISEVIIVSRHDSLLMEGLIHGVLELWSI